MKLTDIKTKLINLPEAAPRKRRIYSSLAGVDFSRLPSSVLPSRSPDALNVYKDYASSLGQAIQTRPGFIKLGRAEGKIYGIHVLGGDALVHYADKIALAVGFPNTISAFNDFAFTMNRAVSSSFIFDGKLYIADGLNYLVYDGSILKAVSENAYVPTTRISACPDGSGAVSYQGINLLSPYRINTFVSDAEAVEYFLSETDLDEETPEVSVNGETLSGGFTYSAALGKVTFESAPSAPMSAGLDNVKIRFKKTSASNAARITGCCLSAVFDNRVFLSGSASAKGVIYHSELEDPSYFAEESFYNDGEDNIAVKALICGTNLLCVIKAGGGAASSKVFYHVASLDETYGKVYPCYTTGVTLGAAAGGINFTDDLVFVSAHGLESVNVGDGKGSLTHRSSNVDTRFANESEISGMSLEVHGGYLMCLTQGRIYLADSRQTFAGANGREYEWYYWDNIGVTDGGSFSPGCLIKSSQNELFFGCENGALCKFTGTNDDGAAINAYWCTPEDIFESPAKLKSVKKRGGAATVKRIPNSVVKIAVRTDRDSFKTVKEARTGGFDFDGLKFTELVFATGERGYVIYSVKRRNIRMIQLKFYSDEADKPFGLYEAVLETEEKRYLRK